MNPHRILPLLLFLTALYFCPNLTAIDYKSEIHPILNKKCFKCHSGPRSKGKLRMDSESYFSKRIGGDKPLIIPGDPASSVLLIKASMPRSNDDAMPPPPARERGAEAMTSSELQLIKQWIAAGASFKPGASTTETTANPSEPETEKVFHTWTNTEGKSLEAAFLGVEGANVQLEGRNGKVISYPIQNLSEKSKELGRELLQKRQ